MFCCGNCNFSSSDINGIHNHYLNHRIDKIGIFLCFFPDCGYKFSKYEMFKQHLNRKHVENKTVTNIVCATNNLFCSNLNCNFNSPSVSELLKHVFDYHPLSDSNKYECPFSTCSKHFLNKNTFKSHIFREHKYSNTVQPSLLSDGILSNNGEQGHSSTEIDHHMDPSQSVDFFPDNYQKYVATVLLKLKSKLNITDYVLEVLIDELNNISHLTEQIWLTKLRNICLQKNSMEIYDLIKKDVTEIVIDKQLKSSYQRDKYLENNFRYLKPIEISLGTNKQGKVCHFHYVPVLKMLEHFFDDKTVQIQFLNPKISSQNGVYGDYTDGSVYKSNTFFTNGDKKIELLVYQDAFEPSNPIGSSKGKQKMIGVYLVVGNLYPHNRGKIDNIQLILLCKDSYFKHFGPNTVLKPFIEDIKILETAGINVKFETGEQILKGSIVAVLGDNLGQNQIGGFNENFSAAINYCRFCDYSKHDLKNKDVSVKNIRTKETYEKDLETLQSKSNPTKANENGIKFNSILNELKYFHVCSPGLPSCIAHDLPEGIVKYDLLMIIKYYVNLGVLTFDYLNETYPNIRKKIHLKNTTFPFITQLQTQMPGSAHQNQYFLLLFPIIMLDFDIDQNSNIWKMLVLLVEITRLSSSPKINDMQVNYLSHIIVEYMELRKKCFENVSLRPKHHFVSHYPNLIREFGPLQRMSTLRFEAKHQYFKEISRKSKNSINITKLLASRHQKLQATIENRFPSDIYADKVFPLEVNMYNTVLPSFLKLATKKICFQGVEYTEKDCIIINHNNNFEITVMEINVIFIDENYKNIVFHGKTCQMWYNFHLGLYENSSQFQNYVTVPFEKLVTHLSFRLFKRSSTLYLSLPVYI